MLFGGAVDQGGEERDGQKGSDEHPSSGKPPLIQCGETYNNCQW